ncbi:MAG: glycosyltransferase [Flavobacteriales bacterium]|nr:glycosyltransferase [Flavobacteriales bacterium]
MVRKTTVSVLINNYNYGEYIGAAINSVLSQTYDGPIEIIAYDDGSTDDSLNVLKSYGKTVSILTNDVKDLGKYPSWHQLQAIEHAFEVSTGDIIFLLDSDDLFEPNKVSDVVSKFSHCPNAVAVQHQFQMMDGNGMALKLEKRPFVYGIDHLHAIFFIGRLDFFFSQTSALAFKRSFLENVLPLKRDELDFLWPDLRLTRLAIFHGTVETIPRKLGQYRVHGVNDSDKLKDKEFKQKFDLQQKAYFKQLCECYGETRTLDEKGKLNSILRVLLVVFSSKMKPIGKLIFIYTYIKYLQSK